MISSKLDARLKACFASIITASFYLLLGAIYIKFQDKTEFIYILKLILVVGLPAYIFYSLIGWVFIGFPLHHAIENYTSSGLRHYFVASLLACILIEVFFGHSAVFIYGIPIVIQSVAFWFFFKKYRTTY